MPTPEERTALKAKAVANRERAQATIKEIKAEHESG
jgi:hypothetical protein